LKYQIEKKEHNYRSLYLPLSVRVHCIIYGIGTLEVPWRTDTVIYNSKQPEKLRHNLMVAIITTIQYNTIMKRYMKKLIIMTVVSWIVIITFLYFYIGDVLRDYFFR